MEFFCKSYGKSRCWTPVGFQLKTEESGNSAQVVVKSKSYHARFPGSSMVEHSAVNRRVASSNLARGANFSFFFNQLQRAIFTSSTLAA